MPFGNWHGSTGNNLDLTNIVSLSILLDKPRQVAHVPRLQYSRLCGSAARAWKLSATIRSSSGLKNELGPRHQPGQRPGGAHEGEWGVTLKEEYFRKIKAAGFNNVRIPVRWSDHAVREEPYTIAPKFIARVDWAVRQALENRLVPVLNMHHYDELFRRIPTATAAASWRFGGRSPSTSAPSRPNWSSSCSTSRTAGSIGPLEPAAGRDAPDRAAEQSARGRSSSGRRAGTASKISICWNCPRVIGNLIVTVHYYDPFHFTHQGASWAGPDSSTGWARGGPVRRPSGGPCERDLDKALAWAVAHRRPIYLGELALSRADMDSRTRWTRFIAQAALERKMGFAYWEFCSSFGAYNSQSDTWIKPLKEALVGTASRNEMNRG